MNVTKKQIAEAVGHKAKPTDVEVIASYSYVQNYSPYIDSVQVDKKPITIIIANLKYQGYKLLIMDIHGRLYSSTGGELLDLVPAFIALLEEIEKHINRFGQVSEKIIIGGIDLTRIERRTQ